MSNRGECFNNYRLCQLPHPSPTTDGMKADLRLAIAVRNYMFTESALSE